MLYSSYDKNSLERASIENDDAFILALKLGSKIIIHKENIDQEKL